MVYGWIASDTFMFFLSFLFETPSKKTACKYVVLMPHLWNRDMCGLSELCSGGSRISQKGPPTQRWGRKPTILANLSRKLHEIEKQLNMEETCIPGTLPISSNAMDMTWKKMATKGDRKYPVFFLPLLRRWIRYCEQCTYRARIYRHNLLEMT